MISLDQNSRDPLYVQIYDSIRRDITENALKPGEKLMPIRKLAENIRQLPEHHMDCLEFMRPDMRHIVAGCVYADMLDCTAQRNYLASQGDDEDAIKTAAYMDTEVEKDMKILHILTSADNESLGNEKEEKK